MKKIDILVHQSFGAGAMLVLMLALSACAYRTTDEDWERNGKVRLLLNWPTAKHPSAMTYYFYKDGTDRPLVRLADAAGYEGTLPVGDYRVVVCNTDCGNVLLAMDNGYDRACGKAREVAGLKSASVPLAHPYNLYGAGCSRIRVDGEATVVEQLHPASLIKTLDLNLRIDIGTDDRLTGLSARLTGVSSEVHIPTGKPLFDTPAFMEFRPEQTASGVYGASLNLFGLHGEGEGGEPVELFLTLTTSSGKEYTTFADITREVGEAFDKSLSAHVVLDLTVVYNEAGGIQLVLTDWKEGAGGADSDSRKVQLRAFSEKLSAESASPAVVFFAKGSESGKYTELWKASVAPSGRASLSETKYYPTDNSPLYLIGFAPEGRPVGEGEIAYLTDDGRQDILLSSEQSGSLADMFWQEKKSFVFTHLLSQLRFRLSCDASGSKQEWRLRSLTAEGAQGEAVLSLNSRTLLFAGKKTDITVCAPTDEANLVPLSADWVELPEVVLIQPGVPLALTAVVVGRNGNTQRFDHLPVTLREVGGTTVAGTSYLLSVVLRAGDACTLSAQVAAWKKGNGGSGDVAPPDNKQTVTGLIN